MSADEIKNIVSLHKGLVKKINHIAKVYDHRVYDVGYIEWGDLRNLTKDNSSLIDFDYDEQTDSLSITAHIYVGNAEYETIYVDCPIKYFSMSDKEIVQDMIEFDKKEKIETENRKILKRRTTK